MCAWVLSIRVAFANLNRRRKHSISDAGPGSEIRDLFTKSPNLDVNDVSDVSQRQEGINLWSWLAKQGLSKAQNELETYALSKLQNKIGANVIIADLANPDSAASIGSALLDLTKFKEDRANLFKSKTFHFSC